MTLKPDGMGSFKRHGCLPALTCKNPVLLPCQINERDSFENVRPVACAHANSFGASSYPSEGGRGKYILPSTIMRGLKSNLRPFFAALEELSLARQVLRLARLDGQGRPSPGDP